MDQRKQRAGLSQASPKATRPFLLGCSPFLVEGSRLSVLAKWGRGLEVPLRLVLEVTIEPTSTNWLLMLQANEPWERRENGKISAGAESEHICAKRVCPRGSQSLCITHSQSCRMVGTPECQAVVKPQPRAPARSLYRGKLRPREEGNGLA